MLSGFGLWDYALLCYVAMGVFDCGFGVYLVTVVFVRLSCTKLAIDCWIRGVV